MAMTDLEKFTFDLAGFFVRPAILTADEIAAIKEQVYKITHEPESLPPSERQVPGGASSVLLGHPKIHDVLSEVIDPVPWLGEPMVRLDSAFCTWREPGHQNSQPLHQGGPMQTDRLFGYHVQNGRINAGMTRVVVELTDVENGDDATMFIPGSHKANFPMHPDHMSMEEGKTSPFLTSYECPAGSAIFFTENLCHTGGTWKGKHERVTVLYAYTHQSVWYTKPKIAPEVIEGLPREKQAFFRAPWLVDFKGQHDRAVNTTERFLETGEEPVDMHQLRDTKAAAGADAKAKELELAE